MAKKVAETLASIDILVLHRLRVLAGECQAERSLKPQELVAGGIVVGAGTDFLSEDESREFAELRQRNGRIDDLERFAAANPDRFRMERVRR